MQKTAYVQYRGVVPVHGTKRDALLRYLYHVFLASEMATSAAASPSHSLAEMKVLVYFIDDQDRYLRDVESYRASLFLAAVRAECPRFCHFVENNVSVKTFLMPQFVPTASSSMM